MRTIKIKTINAVTYQDRFNGLRINSKYLITLAELEKLLAGLTIKANIKHNLVNEHLKDVKLI